jgi:SAM-dependent methyltransferase
MPDRELATTFDSVAELYERSRPGYPDELFADLAGIAGLDRADVLEIGPGTGQATRGLRARGWRVTALEPGADLARVARRVLDDVTVEVTTFEDWAGEGPFDLVFAATSWHWVDPAVGYAKAARLLRPGGSLAVVATAHVLPEDGDPFFREVQADYEAAGLGDGSTGPPPPDAVDAPNVAAIRESGLFEEPEVRRYVHATTYTAEEYLALIGTYSNHIAAAPDQLYAAIRERIGTGTVRKHHLNVLQVARRSGKG